jgi:hypothetical protein
MKLTRESDVALRFRREFFHSLKDLLQLGEAKAIAQLEW